MTIAILFIAAISAFADWPMPGRDAQRTQYDPVALATVPQNVAWWRAFDGFIPSKAQLVTLDADPDLGWPDLVFVPTSKGLHAINAVDGSEFWFYPTAMPLGNSPAVNCVGGFCGGTLYVAGFDRTVHAIDIATGQKIWQTSPTEAGFDTSPLAVDGLVMLGGRDGRFYAFAKNDGRLVWSYLTDGRISYSAARDTDHARIFFASNDGYAYCLNLGNGELVWKSVKLPGDGFYSWWPMVVGQYVIFTGTNNFPQGLLVQRDKEAFPPEPVYPTYPGGAIDADGWMNAQQFLDYFAAHPERRTVHVLDKSTGQRAMDAPFLWNGNPDGCRTPLALGPDGLVYGVNHYTAGLWWLKGRVTAWEIGTPMIREVYPDHDSADETGAIAMIGDGFTYTHKEEQGASFVRDRAIVRTFYNAYSATNRLDVLIPGYDSGWQFRKYGSWNPQNQYRATHGNVVPLVPIGGKLVTHTSNSVVAVGP